MVQQPLNFSKDEEKHTYLDHLSSWLKIQTLGIIKMMVISGKGGVSRVGLGRDMSKHSGLLEHSTAYVSAGYIDVYIHKNSLN